MITFNNLGRLGRFANGMFQIASTIGIAVKNGYDYGFPYWQNYDHRNFNASEDIDVQKYFVNPLPICEDPGKYPDMWVNWGYHGMDFPDNVSINGHLQSPKYFAHCMDIVRHYFRMKDELPQNVFVAIHYRAGDYENDPNAYHPRCSIDYYRKALLEFPEHTSFMVYSDNNEEAVKIFYRSGINRPGNYFYGFTNDNYISHFKDMKRCKSFICANSSYSLMAAILGEHPEKKIICPSRWFGPVAGIDGNDCYPEGAIII